MAPTTDHTYPSLGAPTTPFPSVSTNTFRGGYCYCTREYRPANPTRLRQTTNCCRKSNTTKYRGFKFRKTFGLRTMLIVKVLLLSIIIITTTMTNEKDLTKKFNLEAIMFRFKPHPLPYYDYVAPLFDAQFGDNRIEHEDLVDEGFIIDQSDYKQCPTDVVTRLRNFITAHIKSVVNSDGDDCEDKMNKVVLKTIRKNDNYVTLKTAKHFDAAIVAYQAAEAKRPEPILATNCFIVYLDITKLYILTEMNILMDSTG